MLCNKLCSHHYTDKNQYYCELTAQYWVWKNIADKYNNIGLCHYRRYFADSFLNRNHLLRDKSIERYLDKCDIILPEKWYWKETVAERYYVVGKGKEKDLETTRNVIQEMYPDYLNTYNEILNKHEASYCNMFVTSRKKYVLYCEWLFNILKEVEKRTDISSYNAAEARVYGYLSEILLNVWVEKNRYRVKHLPLIEPEISFLTRIKKDLKNITRKCL